MAEADHDRDQHPAQAFNALSSADGTDCFVRLRTVSPTKPNELAEVLQARQNRLLLKRIVKLKSELSSILLRPGFSNTIHAVGIGKLERSDDYCIQVFVKDANEELWESSRMPSLPSYGGFPVVTIEMPPASFSSADLNPNGAGDQYPNGIREHQEVIIGGISGAHRNLSGQSGTIGYFCTRKSKLPRRKEVHILSNSHVFADLRKTSIDENDLIMQPSPCEPTTNRPIGTLVNFSPLKFNGDLSEPNHIDAAIARLWGPMQHKPLIPVIGPVKGHIEKKDIAIGEVARKFGRTTGYTEGHVFSTHLDIWIRYDRTGKSAFFQDQLLIRPSFPAFTRFVAKGDSGALVVNANQHALGLLFASAADAADPLQSPGKTGLETAVAAQNARRIEGYGVANPISEVLARLEIELLV